MEKREKTFSGKCDETCLTPSCLQASSQGGGGDGEGGGSVSKATLSPPQRLCIPLGREVSVFQSSTNCE